MKIVDLGEERIRRSSKTEVEPGVEMFVVGDDENVAEMVLPTATGGVALLIGAEGGNGILLNTLQAVEVAVALLQAAALIDSGALDVLLADEPEEKEKEKE